MDRNNQGKFVKGHSSYNYKGVIWKKCKYCKKDFYVTSRNKRKMCCSNSCSHKQRFKTLKQNGSFLKGEFGKCFKCGKKIYFEPREIGKNKFCSRKCFYEYRKGWINDDMKEALAKGRKTQRGKEKSEHMKKQMSITYKKKWANLRDRELMMKDRTPEKLKNFREGHKKYLEKNKGKLPISKLRNKRVIDKIIKNGN